LVIIQASHVGFDPETRQFGNYRRLQTENAHHSSNCGKIGSIVREFEDEYTFARNNIFLEAGHSSPQVSINNLLLKSDRNEGIFLNLDHFIARDDNDHYALLRSQSTAQTFKAAPELITRVGQQWPNNLRQSINEWLIPELFHFKRNLVADTEGQRHLEQNLIDAMPWIVTDAAPTLAAAQINTQVEFDRTYRTILQEPSYQNRNLLFISGLNIDISPRKGQTFPLTKFIPWAAYVQSANGAHSILEQQELFDKLMASDSNNPRQIDLEAAIADMEEAEEVSISFDFRE
jgi:hypothetical protein